jgi:hypothetical protein
MPLSWNEIKSRALIFSKEWQSETDEDSEAKTFWDDFFLIFDVKRRRLAAFEYHVKKLNNKHGYIDLFWPGTLIVEHKSKGKSLDKAHNQVLDYFDGIADTELPRYILVSDFSNFRLYDLDEKTQVEFPLNALVQYVTLFGFIASYPSRTIFKEQDPVNVDAAVLMGGLHDMLKDVGYNGHALEVYLVRLLFCLFADDTSIFEKGILSEYLELKTNPDGSDLAMHLDSIFITLNTPAENRLRNLDESLTVFPYVNGKLFEERLPIASFDSKMRVILLDCCNLNWSKISPAIFGSLFQSVMDKKARRNLGAHYTSEKNILKLIKPLFLDSLWLEFEKTKKESRARMESFHNKISNLRFLDPACGCGNFLIIAYREIRLLEIEVIKILLKDKIVKQLSITDIGIYFRIDVDRFYGIEHEEFPAQIAQVAMWLIDHQMNMIASETFGEYYIRLPLVKSATIAHGNALELNWQSLIIPIPNVHDTLRYNYILGNPPFAGKKEQDAGQKIDMSNVFAGVKGAGVLDYVCAWYIRAAQYLDKANKSIPKGLALTEVAFVSTNSVTQGEQVGILWSELHNSHNIKINFAHRTFKWSNEAQGQAAVHVVIIGFSNFDSSEKTIYEYETINSEPHQLKVKNINAYLVDGLDVFLPNRKHPILPSQEIVYGSFALDDGNYTLSEEEKEHILSVNPESNRFIRGFIGGRELLHSEKRFCIWLLDASPTEIKNNGEILKRVQAVRKWRSESDRGNTKKLANTPTIFAEIRQPKGNYLAFPTLSSVSRHYIPIAYLNPEIIASNQLYVLPDANLYVFGILTSQMHMTWTKYVCGRFKSDYRYSAGIVYNNYPWPENASDKQKNIVEQAAQEVLNVRELFSKNNLSELYDPNTMPPGLVKAHQFLDKAVDLCYKQQSFSNETKRIEFLFELYDKYTAGLFAKEKKNKLTKR